MNISARRLLATLLTLSFLMIFPSISSPIFASNSAIAEIGMNPVMNEKYTISENELTTWYHDGSNTTGWTTEYSGWTLNSSGTALYSQCNSSGSAEHAVFVYNLGESFVVGHDFKIEAQVEYTPIGTEDGGLNLMTFYGSFPAYRLAYSGFGSTKASWAINHYTGEMLTYDSEYSLSYMSYSSMWYNSTDSTTRTNLGDGIVSTSDHAAPARKISSITLDFWAQSSTTSPDIRIDWIKITGGLVPEIDSPNDVEMEYSDDMNLVWTPEAYNPDTYELYIDDVLEITGMWNGSQLGFPLTGLDPGYYKYELFVYDDLDYYDSDIVYVNVTDSTLPIVNDVTDFDIPYGVNGEYITWACSEPYPDYFTITKDSVVIDEGSWNGTDLSVNLNGLSVDSYIFEVTVNDTSGNSASDLVTVTVSIDDPPSVTPLEDAIIELGSTGNYLVWVCSDEFPDSFIILQNGTEIDSGAWNGSSLAVNINGLDLGVYLYELHLIDESANEVITNVTVFVVDTTVPVIEGMDDMIFIDSAMTTLEWNVTDLDLSHYFIYYNGTPGSLESLSGTEDTITFGLVLHNLGVYNFTLLVYDSSGNYATHTVIVTVTASTTTTTTTSTTSTTSETSTTTTNSTGGGESPDSMLLLVLGAVGALVVILLLVVILKKK